MPGLDDVTVVTVNYNTPDLLRRLLTSVRCYYPDIEVLVVDGSDLRRLRKRSERLCEQFRARCEAAGWNIHHGPGLHRGVASAQTEYCVVIDSDAAFTRPGFIETAFAALRDTDFGVGEIEWVDEHGHNVSPNEGTPYLHPRLALWRRAAYLEGPPAIRHGAPLLPVMQHLQHSRWTLGVVPDMDTYFVELGRGTVNATGGYHLKGEAERLHPYVARARRKLADQRTRLRRRHTR